MAFVRPLLPFSSPRSLPQSHQPRPLCMRRPSPSPKSPPSSNSPPSSVPSPTSFLLSLGLSQQSVSRILSRHPTLNTPSLPTLATPTLDYLKSLKLSPAQIARVIRHAPQILYRHPPASHADRLHFLDQVACIPPSQLPRALARAPHILWMDLRNASQVVNKLLHLCPNLTPTTLGAIFTTVPHALLSSPTDIQDRLNCIREAGVSDPPALARVVSKRPLVLVLDIKKTIQKRLHYLQTELGFSPKTVGKILVASPDVLEASVDKVLKPRVKVLQGLVGVDALQNVVDKVPSIFALDDILDRVLWLRDEVGLDQDQVRIVIQNAPAILTYSVVGNLAPKWAFIRDTMGGNKHHVVQAPRETLCANLQQRAMPRYAFLMSAGKMNVDVLDILRGSDHEFCKNVAKCQPGEFREYVDNDTYLLFFSQLI